MSNRVLIIETAQVWRNKMEKYAIITGASSGIGKEFAIRLAKDGYALILVARREQYLELIREELIQKYKITVTIMPLDISRKEECDQLIEYAKEKNIEVFINNAGFGICGVFSNIDVEKELDMIDVNIKALHYLSKKVIELFKEKGDGYLLNVASSAGLMPAGPYMATYYATKAYVASLTGAISEELKQQGSKIYVGCLCPGPVDTEFNEVANVKFALKGISASYCANVAVNKMYKRKKVIIPTLKMKLVLLGSRLAPRTLVIRICSNQQKKKIHH